MRSLAKNLQMQVYWWLTAFLAALLWYCFHIWFNIPQHNTPGNKQHDYLFPLLLFTTGGCYQPLAGGDKITFKQESNLLSNFTYNRHLCVHPGVDEVDRDLHVFGPVLELLCHVCHTPCPQNPTNHGCKSQMEDLSHMLQKR